MSYSTFSIPGMRDIDAWIFYWSVICAATRIRGTIALMVVTLLRLDHLYAAVLSTPVGMCSSGDMRGAKSWRWVMYAASSRFLIIKDSLGVLTCENVVSYGSAKC